MLKRGMYVRCPLDENALDARVYAYGRINKISDGNIEVRFFDHYKLADLYELDLSKKTFTSAQVTRDAALIDSFALYFGEAVEIKLRKSEEDGYFNYVVYNAENARYLEVSEQELEIDFRMVSVKAKEQMKRFELHHPIFYFNRRYVNEVFSKLKHSTFGFQQLLSSRVFLMKHQVDSIIRGLFEDKCRLMLADEVGLGKTIEACVILRGLREKYNGNLITLIITPKTLVSQWKAELNSKFWIDSTLNITEANPNVPLIMTHEDLISLSEKDVLGRKWDMVIIDEAHRLIQNEQLFQQAIKISKAVDHLLLLSATPIQNRAEEYLRLLSLLNPIRFNQMQMSEFMKLLDKQNYLRSKVYSMMQNLSEYFDDDWSEDFEIEFDEISKTLNDDLLNGIIKSIDFTSEDRGYEMVRKALAYITTNYQIEKKVIRHRRIELDEIMPKRNSKNLTYEMKSGSDGYFEREVYTSLIALCESISTSSNNTLELTSNLILSMSSSPWALEKVLYDNKYTIGRFDEFEDCLAYTKRWKEAVISELENYSCLFDDPDLINGKLLLVADYIDQNKEDNKIVVFSESTETIQNLYQYYNVIFGEETVACYYNGMDLQLMQSNVDQFQGNEKCRILLCDWTGGEGRNFQIAEEMIHLDLPWNISALEQRIGRLDRIGRKKDLNVTSVVITAVDSIMEDYSYLLNNVFNIFNESLSGLEIIMGDFEKEINNAFNSDFQHGLRHINERMKVFVSQMKNEVERERYYDVAKQLDPKLEMQLENLVELFDSKSSHLLLNAMLSWANVAGLHPTISENTEDKIACFRRSSLNINSMRNLFVQPPDTREILKRSKNPNEIHGTFSRKLAISRDNLVFFGPSDPFYDTIIHNCIESYRGKSCAFAILGPIEWEGFEMTYKIDINLEKFIELGIGYHHANFYYSFIKKPLVRYFFSLTNVDNPEHDKILSEIVGDPRNYKKTSHLGRRKRECDFYTKRIGFNGSPIMHLKSEFPVTDWARMIEDYRIKANKLLESQLKEIVDIKGALDYINNEIYVLEATSNYYGGNSSVGDSIELYEKMKEAVKHGLIRPKINIDSIAYIRVIKYDEASEIS